MVKISTYNITWSTRINDSNSDKYGWSVRWPKIVKNILEQKSDIICLQEVHSDFVDDIYKFAEEHKYYTTGMLFNKRKPSAKGVTFLYVLSKEKVKSFSVHNTTYIESKDKVYPYLKVDFEEFSVINCHLSTQKDAKLGALKTLFKFDKTIIVGDFNTFDRHWKEMFKYVIEQKYDDITNPDNSDVPVVKTFKPFKYDYEPIGATSHLDHIYYKKSEFKFNKVVILVDEDEASDHFMVTGYFKI